MSSNRSWCKLFYDKFAHDHHFCNELTKNVLIDDLEDGSYYLYTDKDAMEYYNKKFDGHFQIPKIILNCDSLYRLSVYTKNIDGVETIYTVIFVNIKRLEYYVKNKISIPHEDILKKLCRYHLSYTNSKRLSESIFYSGTNDNINKIDENIKFMINKIMTSADYTFHEKITDNDQKDITVKLFEYQRCSIYWMLEKENCPKKIYYNMNEEVVMGNVYFDLYSQSFYMINDHKSLTFDGGCLIDEVGLGKTIQILTLSILNQPNVISYINKDDKYHLYSRATLILCPNQLCGQWKREIEDKISNNYRPQVCVIMTKTHFNKYTYQEILDADFVIISYTFLGNQAYNLHWTQKISNVKSFIKQHWSISDIALVKQMFNDMGENLTKDPIGTYLKTDVMFQLINWYRIVIDEFHEIYSNPKYRYVQNLLPFFGSVYRWCVTATPFIKQSSMHNTINFLTKYENNDGENILTNPIFVDHISTDIFRRNTKESVKGEHTLPPIEEEIRWLKFSTTERMMYNAYIANPNNNKIDVYLRKLCCHPKLANETKLALSNCKTLKDIETMMLQHYKKDVLFATDKVNKVNDRIKKINKQINKLENKQKKNQLRRMGIHVDNSDDGSDDDVNIDNIDFEDFEEFGINIANIKSATMDNLKESLKRSEERLIIANNFLEGKTTTFNFFNNVIERLKTTTSKDTSKKRKEYTSLNFDDLIGDSDESDSDESDSNEELCGVCLDDVPEDDVGVTKCGHIFCYECLKITVSKYHNCPYCKHKLNDNDIFLISYEKPKNNICDEDKKKDDLINEVGTKLANLILYLKENNNHTIIFSQWDDLLRRVGIILSENKIKNVFCKGNCYQRDKAIREFNKDDSIKVIMLSSEQSASGTNLTKAKQVIFLDPIYGNYKYRKGQERQAIGRAHRLGQMNVIKVIRFIIKNSIEEEIYWMNMDEDKKYNEIK